MIDALSGSDDLAFGFAAEIVAPLHVAALAGVLGIDRFLAAGYSMGGFVAQLLYRRHSSLLSGLVLCATAPSMHGSPMENMLGSAPLTMVAAMRENPLVRAMATEIIGAVLLDDIDDTRTRQWARAQLRRTSPSVALSAVQAVCEFSSHDWIGRVDIPTAVVITTQDRIVPHRRQRQLAHAIQRAAAHEIPADHGVFLTKPDWFARVLLRACDSVRAAAPERGRPGTTIPAPGGR